jgi:O-acetyl-ADP-ribose deacetylase (regulator of RNase III)
MAIDFEVLFVDESPDVINALASAFGRYSPGTVRFTIGNLFASEPGVLVSPTNSDGDMSAGVDLQLRSLFPHLESLLQTHILSLPSKRLSIDTVVLAKTGDATHPLVIFTPTFRTPWDLASQNRVYRAAVAVFLSVRAHNAMPDREPIPKILMPGFGTGVGGLDPSLAARKMYQAYRHALSHSLDECRLPSILGNDNELAVD